MADTGSVTPSQKRGKLLFTFKDSYRDRNDEDRMEDYNQIFTLSLFVLICVGFSIALTNTTEFNPGYLVQGGLVGVGTLACGSFLLYLLFAVGLSLKWLILPSERKVKVYTKGIKILHSKDSWFRRFDRYLPFAKVKEMKEIGNHYLLVILVEDSSHQYTLRNPEYTKRVLKVYQRYQEQQRSA